MKRAHHSPVHILNARQTDHRARPGPTTFTRPHAQGSSTGALEFISDSSEVVDDALEFDLNHFATVTSLSLQFPAGDTYKFDVLLYDIEGELLYTQEVRKPRWWRL